MYWLFVSINYNIRYKIENIMIMQSFVVLYTFGCDLTNAKEKICVVNENDLKEAFLLLEPYSALSESKLYKMLVENGVAIFGHQELVSKLIYKLGENIA